MKRTHCPTCATTVGAPQDNEFFPFCGCRCRSVDLGRWLDGEYRLSEEPRDFFELDDERSGESLRVKGLASLFAIVLALSASSAMAQAGEPTGARGTTTTTTTTGSPSPEPTHEATPAPPPRPAPAPPPPDVAPPAEQQAAEAAPHEDEHDHGVVYIGGDFGYSWINLVQFSSNNFIPAAERTDGNGWTFALDAGFRVFWFTIGARGTLASYPGFELGTVGLDLGLHIPIPFIEPYIRGGLSYGWMGNANYRTPGLSDTTVTGLVGDVGAGVDLYLNDHISVGAGVDAAFLNLTRQKITTGAAGMVTDINVSESGDAVGLQLRFHGQLTIHI